MTKDEGSTMLSTREVPWMKLGTVIDEPLTPREAIVKAGLDWTVRKEPLFIQGKGGKLTEVPDRWATVTSKGKVLGTVGKAYETYQNTEAFDFLEPVVADGQLPIHAAGQLRGGRQVFIVAKVTEGVTLLDDPHDLYLIVRTGHDGTKAVQAMVMPLRGMCMNMLGLPSFGRNAEQRWSVQHISTMRERLVEAQATLEHTDSYAREYEETAERLVSVQVELDDLRELLTAALPNQPTRAKNVERIEKLFTDSSTIDDRFRGTGWAAINAVTEFMDWERGRSTHEGRFHSVMDGTSARVRNRVTSLLLAR